MMANFLGNLLLRSGISSAAQPAGTTLQPRLPSLFESTGRNTEFPIPPPDPALKIAQQSSKPPPEELRPRAPLSSSRLIEPWRTILPDTDREASLQILPAGKAGGPESHQSFEASKAQAGSLAAWQATARDEDDGDVTHRLLPVIKPGAEAIASTPQQKRILAPQPVAATSRRATAQLEHARQPERIVEIHIGRVEVRAMPPPPSPKPTRPTSPLMSLDEYLRKRNGGQR